jgi:hypothetical protein
MKPDRKLPTRKCGSRFPSGAVLLLALTATLAAGCTSTSKAKTEAQRAYQMGQEETWRQIQIANPNAIRIQGPVQNPILQWTPDMTLAGAIVEAGCQVAMPRQIVLLRPGQAPVWINPKQLLQGNDIPLHPGDTVQIAP